MPATIPDLVRLTGMRFSAIHGVYDFERVRPQSFVVDLTCELLPRPKSDELSTTVTGRERTGSRAVRTNSGEP